MKNIVDETKFSKYKWCDGSNALYRIKIRFLIAKIWTFQVNFRKINITRPHLTFTSIPSNEWGERGHRHSSRGSKNGTPDRMHFTELRSDPWFQRYGLCVINFLCMCVCVCLFYFLLEREFNSESNGTNNFAIGWKLIEIWLF